MAFLLAFVMLEHSEASNAMHYRSAYVRSFATLQDDKINSFMGSDEAIADYIERLSGCAIASFLAIDK